MSDWNTKIIGELRANGGEIAAGPMAGRTLLILSSTGARSGQPREAVLTYTREGHGYVVAGTAGGSPTTPSWVHNLVAHPDAQIEVKGRRIPIRATVVDDETRQRLWSMHVAQHPEFAGYPEKTTRVIPIIRLEPVAEA